MNVPGRLSALLGGLALSLGLALYRLIRTRAAASLMILPVQVIALGAVWLAYTTPVDRLFGLPSGGFSASSPACCMGCLPWRYPC
jgi:hypothetical protein